MSSDGQYEPKSVLQAGTKTGLQATAVGVFVSSIQNALGTHSYGASGFLTRSGGTIGFFAAMGAAFSMTDAAVANFRESDDAVNGAAGGCAAGFLAGIRARSLPMAIGTCAFLGAAVGGFDYAGRSLVGNQIGLSKEERRRRFFKQQPEPEPLPAE